MEEVLDHYFIFTILCSDKNNIWTIVNEFQKAQTVTGKQNKEAIPKAYFRLLSASFLSGNVHGDLTDAAQLPRGRTFVFPELSVADGIPSTEIIFVLHLRAQSPGLQAGYWDRVTDS